ncbi:uncharacterized protein [Setaria viridis]|uniref:uncharacterized protein n=1 Tax=Setaria viridis TaxID=4556 RepID=UPI003B3B8F12
MAGSLPPPESSATAKHDAAAAEAAKRVADASAADAAQRRAARKEARAAALTHTITAEVEAVAVVQERDAATAHLREALARAAQERKGAPPDSDEEDARDDLSVVYDQAPDTQQAMLLHEAVAVLNLHAQAVAVQNIWNLIPIILDVAADNYSWWREQFLLTVGKYSLQDHVLRGVPALASPNWGRMDCVVQSWLYGTIAYDLVDVVMEHGERGATARATWLTIETQFLSNRETWALYLDAQFRNFVQGYLSITDYCRRFKSMADALGDLGEPVSNRTLILNIIRRLNEKFAAIGRDIRHSRPLRSFLEARDDLLLEELTMASPASTPSMALLTGVNTKSSSRPSAPPHQSVGCSNSGGGKGDGKGGSSGGNSSKQK